MIADLSVRMRVLPVQTCGSRFATDGNTPALLHYRCMATPSLRRQDFILNTHLHQAWKRASLERLDPHLSVEREERLFGVIGTCDPTPDGHYRAWLSAWRRRQWGHLGLRYVCSSGQLQGVTTGLEHFHRVRPHLPAGQRDVGQYRTADELLDIEYLLSDQSRMSLRAEEKKRAYAVSSVLYEEGRWKLVHLLGQEAAEWWGRGTRWCTAARNGNRFASYAAGGDLLVILTPHGKFQLATATGEFRDAADWPADLATTLRDAPDGVRRLCLSARQG